MNFDPSVYQRPAGFDMQKDPILSEAAWIERFVAHLIKCGSPVANDEFRGDLESYAAAVAQDYLAERKEYVDPEEAADTDISYWEDDE